jgi:putative multiple sugar transport system permease protein
MADKQSSLGGHLRENGMLLALVAIVALFSILVSYQGKPMFLQAPNITNIFLQNGHVIILALGMLLIIVSGHIDLSVGSVAAFTGAVAAWLTVDLDLPVALVIPLTLIVGGLIGAAQGYWVAFWRIPSFIVTLAGMMVFRGATLWLLGGQNIGPFPKGFQAMSSGFIPDLTGLTKPHGLTLIIAALAIGIVIWIGLRARARDAEFGLTPEPSGLFWGRTAIIAAAMAFVGWQLASFRGLPNVLVVLAVLIVLYAFFTENTVQGRRIYAVGGNEKAAKLSGISTDRLVFFCFVNMGVLAALAGHDGHRPPELCHPQGRHRVRARRHRRRLHRRGLHGGRLGQDHRCRHRRADHGRDEHGHVDPGHRHRLPADDQGPGPSRRRDLRRLQQEQVRPAMHLSTVKGVGPVVRDGTEARSLRNTASVYELATAAINAGHGLAAEIARRGLGETVDLSRASFDLPVSHPDPAHLHLTGTGLTHLGSASARDAMHAKLEGTETLTDSMKMFRMGLEGGRPRPARSARSRNGSTRATAMPPSPPAPRWKPPALPKTVARNPKSPAST